MNTIEDLADNEHVLNFHKGVEALPDWLGSDLKLILGAGDYTRDKLDVEKFTMFDVFFCLPEENQEGSIRANLQYILDNYKHKKVICYLDISNTDQVKQFCKLFTNRIVLVDGYLNHTPHLPLECIAKILKAGGKAVNLYETTNHRPYYTTKEIDELCRRDLKKENTTFFFGNVKANLTAYKECIDSKITQLLQSTPIQFDVSLLSEMDNKAKLRLIAVLLEYSTLPQGLQGTFQKNTRIWDTNRTFYELVVTKVTQGGRKRKTRRHKHKSKTRKH